jgi:hypothetical protein
MYINTKSIIRALFSNDKGPTCHHLLIYQIFEYIVKYVYVYLYTQILFKYKQKLYTYIKIYIYIYI